MLFPIEATFLQSHGVSDSCSLWDIGCGDGSWLRLFRFAFPNSAVTGLDRSPEILARTRKQNPVARPQEKRTLMLGWTAGLVLVYGLHSDRAVRAIQRASRVGEKDFRTFGRAASNPVL